MARAGVFNARQQPRHAAAEAGPTTASKAHEAHFTVAVTGAEGFVGTDMALSFMEIIRAEPFPYGPVSGGKRFRAVSGHGGSENRTAVPVSGNTLSPEKPKKRGQSG